MAGSINQDLDYDIVLSASEIQEAANTGALNPAAGTDDAAVGTVAWSNPGNADGAADGTVASAASDGTTHYLKLLNVGPALDTSVEITGIIVRLLRRKVLSDLDSTATNPGTTDSQSGAGTISWTDHANIAASDDAYATAAGSGEAETEYLVAKNFGFAAVGTIQGIEVAVERGYVAGSPDTGHDFAGSGSGWTNSGNITADDGNTADIASTPSGSPNLIASSFGFNIPTGRTILGVEVKVERHATGNFSTTTFWEDVVLYNGSDLGNDKAPGGSWTGTPTVDTIGGAADTWGASLTPAIVNSTSFGVRMKVAATGLESGHTAHIDYVTMRVWYSAGDVIDSQVRLRKADGTIATVQNKADTMNTWAEADTTKTYGSETDTWGESLTPTDINDADFGVAISVLPGDNTARVDHVTMTVHYGDGSVVDSTVRLVVGGAVSGLNRAKTSAQWPLTLSSAEYGAKNDLWGVPLSASDVNGATFGVVVSAVIADGGTAEVDAAEVEIHYLETTTGAQRVGFMLAAPVDQFGNPLPKRWMIQEVPTPVNIRVSEEGVGQTDIPPELGANVFRDIHDGGMGKHQIVIAETDHYSSVAQLLDDKIIKPASTTEVTLPSSEGDVRVWFEFGSNLYVSDGRYLHRSSDGTTFAQVLDVGVDGVITDAIAFGASDGDTGIVVAFETSGTPDDAYFSTSGDAGSWTQYTTDPTRQHSFYFKRDETLFALKNPNTMYSTTDPFVAGAIWGGATEVGDELHDFQGGEVVADVAVIRKEDQVYTVDSSGAVKTLIAQFNKNPGPHNFRHAAAAFNSNIYTTVDEEVWEYDPVSGNLRPLGLVRLADTEVDATLDHEDGVAYDGGALFVLHHTNYGEGGTSILRVTQDREGEFIFQRWMEETETTSYRPQGPFHATRLFTSRKTGRALYFATTTAGKVGILNLPRAADPTLDTTSEYTTKQTTYRSGWFVHNFPSQTKDYVEVVLDARNLSPSSPLSTIDVYYYLDGDEATAIELVSGLDTDGLHRLPFGGVSGRSIMLELRFNSDTVTDTPIVLSWSVRASVKFIQQDIITFTARIADNVPNRYRQLSPHTAIDLRNFVRAIRRAQNVTIGYEDYRGYAFSDVRVLPGIEEVDASDEQSGADETRMTLRLLRVSNLGE